MKNPDNIEKEIDIIRKKLQKERESLTVEEVVEKTNKTARELAKKYGFKFLTGEQPKEYQISQSDFSDGMIAEEVADYNAKKKGKKEN